MRRHLRVLPIAWLLLLLCVPLGGWALGERQPLLDNRPKTAVPHLGGGALGRTETYAQLDQALLERLPPRGRALRVHGRIAIDLFHDSPNPDVVIGHNGYYYYKHSLQTCDDAPPPDDPADAVDVVARTILASGRQALVLEPAAKELIHRQAAESVDRGKLACALAFQAKVDQRMARTPGAIDFDAPLRRSEADGTAVYLPRDTHWNWRGRLLYVKTVLDFLRPGLAAAVGLHAGPAFRRPADLSAEVGLDDRDADREVVTTRTPDPPLKPGGAVIIGDSQTGRAFTDPPGPPGTTPLAATVLAGIPICSVEKLYSGKCNAPLLGASKVVFESVGRNLAQFSKTCWGIVQLLGGDLTGPRGSFQRVDGTAPVTGRTVTIGASGVAQLRFVAPGGDVADRPRLLRTVVSHLPAGQHVSMDQAPQAGPSSPCSSPIQPTDANPLILTVPAGRRVSDLVVRITAPPGTVLGAPQEIVLDGRPAPRTAGRRPPNS